MNPRKSLKKIFVAFAAVFTLGFGAGAPLVIDHVLNPPPPPSPWTDVQTKDGMTEDSAGNKSWWENGKLHRTDGPAIEWADGTKEWRQFGELHRTNGPALEYADGNKAFYKNGQLMSETEFNASQPKTKSLIKWNPGS